jgi:hypothetical protein
VGFSDSFRRFFSRRQSIDLGPLRAFAAERRGVEGYIEPRTATQPLTLLLVDRYGETIRAAIRGPRDARDFCAQAAIPLYDASVIGYPQRMIDFEQRGGKPGKDALDEQIADLERRLQESD